MSRQCVVRHSWHIINTHRNGMSTHVQSLKELPTAARQEEREKHGIVLFMEGGTVLWNQSTTSKKRVA